MVSVLFVVIIILAIGITRFYFDVSKDTGSSSAPAEIIRKLDVDNSGNRIFEGNNSLYGVVDSGDKVIVAPEWTELSFASDGLCIAAKRIGGRMLTGCVDYEGNIVVPFIYRNIGRYESDGFVFYIAESDSDGSCVMYTENFTPYFMRSWDSCSVTEDELVLTSGDSIYTYSCGENGLLCTKADIAGQALGIDFRFNISSRLILSRLDCSELEKITENAASYLEYAFTGDPSFLTALNTDADSGTFTRLFPDDAKITSRKLTGISDIFIYTERLENGSYSYAVSIMTDTEIEYIDENEELCTLEDSYKAIVRFGSSANGITAVSGAFVQTEPDYPVYEEPTEPYFPENDGYQNIPGQ